MALNFPGSPTPNQVYTDTTTKLSWVWNDVLGAWESAEQPPVIVSDLQPDTTSTGKLWYRPATNVLKVYNGSEWTEAKSVFGVNYSSTAPTLRPDGSALQNGDQWYDFDDNKFYIYDAGSWVDIAPNLGSPSFAAGTSSNPGLFVTGDSDTGLYSPGANQLAFATGGTGRIIIDSSGQVGIGGTPVSGTLFGVYSTINGGTLTQVIENKSTTGNVKLNFNRGVNGAQGTSSITYIPGTEFSIGPDSNDALTPFVINTNNSTERFRIGADGTLTVGDSPAAAKFSISGSAPSNSVIIDSFGKTGIGAVPTFKLDVVSTSGTNTIRSFSSGSTDARFVAKTSANETIFGTDSTGSYITQAGNLPLRILTNNVESFRVLSDGSVSIKNDGVTDAKLHVSGSKTSNIVHFEAGTGQYDGIYLRTETLAGQNGGVKWIPNTTPPSGTTQFTTNFASNTSGGTVKHNVRIEGDLSISGTINSVEGSYLTSSNYTTYTVTKTGTGASGTWNININGSSTSCTGNAATSTTSTLATNVVGTGNRILYNNTTNTTTTSNNLTFDGNTLSVGGSINSGGTLNGSSLAISSNGSIGNTLTVGTSIISNGSISGNTITSSGTLTGNSVVSTTTMVTGTNHTVGNNLTVTGSIIANTDIKVNTIRNISGTQLYLARAWVNFNGTGVVSIRKAGNVSSITDLGTGNYRVNFTTAMSDVNYSPVFGDIYYTSITEDNVATRTTSSLTLIGYNEGNVLSDLSMVSVAIFN
jgi:hypothetical protein